MSSIQTASVDTTAVEQDTWDLRDMEVAIQWNDSSKAPEHQHGAESALLCSCCGKACSDCSSCACGSCGS
ncbi:hypothetical protein GCM10009638_02760 [Luteococcus sanguinis]